MNPTPWTEDASTLFDLSQPLMYDANSDANTNTNAMARFVVVWTLATVAGTALLPLFGGRVDYQPFAYFLLLAATALWVLSRPPSEPLAPPDATASQRFCQAPSRDNPLANPMPSDYNNGPKLPACPAAAVSARIERQANDSPILGAAGVDALDPAAQRAFYSVPGSAIPNDREHFLHSLYGDGLKRTLYHGI